MVQYLITQLFGIAERVIVFRPAGRGVTKSLKKLFNEAKIPPSKRDDIVILADGDHILWIEGFGPSEFGCITSNTKEFISIDIEGFLLNHHIEKVLFSELEIAAMVQKLGQAISRDYQNRNLLLVSLMKGSLYLQLI